MAMQRAQDKIAKMQARAGAVDELLGVRRAHRPHRVERPAPGRARQVLAVDQVELELAQLKGQLAPAGDARGDRSREPATASRERPMPRSVERRRAGTC